jgi:AraC-like DNA-binding protein
MNQFRFRSLDGSDIAPQDWLNIWSDRYPSNDYAGYSELIAKHKSLSAADFALIGKWKDAAKTEGKWKPRRIKEFVDARMEDELTLCEMAQSVGLSTAHFSRMFHKSTGETPHQFLLRQRVERAKEMLRSADARVIDVAVACGFKTQQHFAQVFRHECGASPTEYRQDFLGHEATCARETCSQNTLRLCPPGSAAKL